MLEVLVLVSQQRPLTDYEPVRQPGASVNRMRPFSHARQAAIALRERGLVTGDVDGDLEITEAGTNELQARQRLPAAPKDLVANTNTSRALTCDEVTSLASLVMADGEPARIRGEIAHDLVRRGLAARVAEDPDYLPDTQSGSLLRITRAGKFMIRSRCAPFLGFADRQLLDTVLRASPPYTTRQLSRLRVLVGRGIVSLDNTADGELAASLTAHGKWLVEAADSTP